MSLSGKVAIVTGSGRGLGLAYARRARRAQGAAVVVNDVDARDAADAVASDRRPTAAGPSPWSPRWAPPRPPSSSCSAPSTEFGRLDILVTNAGILRDKVLWKMTRRGLRRRDQRPPARHLHLRPRGRRLHAEQRRGRPHHPHRLARPASAATSARPTTPPPRPASSAWSRTWAMELKRAGVTVNAVSPGRRHRHDRDRPVLRRRPSRPTSTASRCRPSCAATRLRHGRGRRRARRLPRLRRRGRRHRPGHRHRRRPARSCGRTPSQVRAAYRDGGWSYDALADDFGTQLRRASCRASARTSAAAGGPPAPGSRAEIGHDPLRTRDRRRRAHAIDVHVHIEVDGARPRVAAATSSIEASAKYFRPTARAPTLDRSPRTTASARWPPSSSPSTPRTRLGHARDLRTTRSPRARRATTTC